MLTLLAILMTIIYVAAPVWLLFDCARPHSVGRAHRESPRKTAA